MATRLRGPLSLALAIALLPLAWATRAVWTAPFNHTSSHVALPLTGRPPAQTTPSPTPRPTPKSTPLTAMLAADRFDLGAPRAYGRIDVVGYDHHHDIDVGSYTVAATPPSMPSSLPVWKLHGFAAGADTPALAARLGIHPLATPLSPGMSPDGCIDAAAAVVWAGGGNSATLINVDTRPADTTAAMAATSRVLADLGLFPQNADATAFATGDTMTPGWIVTYTRRPIGGVPVGFGLLHQGIAEMQITELGNVTRVSVDNPAVDGGAPYPLRTWREAWADVSRGHWFDECCYVNTGGGGPSKPLAFRADRITLVYEAVGFPSSYLVPMYVFTDSHNQDAALSVPALRLADLSEPGGFRLTEPGAG